MCWGSSLIIISWMWLWLKSISNKKEESKCMWAFLQEERITVSHGQCVHAQWILRDPLDCSLPGSSVHGTLQAKILEWVAISFSRESSWPRDWTWVSCVSYIGRQVLYQLSPWENPIFFSHIEKGLNCAGHLFWPEEVRQPHWWVQVTVWEATNP